MSHIERQRGAIFRFVRSIDVRFYSTKSLINILWQVSVNDAVGHNAKTTLPTTKNALSVCKMRRVQLHRFGYKNKKSLIWFNLHITLHCGNNRGAGDIHHWSLLCFSTIQNRKKKRMHEKQFELNRMVKKRNEQ